MPPKPVDPFLFVIFGATGDLGRRKLLPALYQLTRQGHFDRSLILGTGRSTDIDDRQFRTRVRESLSAVDDDNSGQSSWCDDRVYYRGVGKNDPGQLRKFAATVEDLERRFDLTENRIFYLALPPGSFAAAIRAIGELGLHRSRGWTRLVIEKPFGTDLESARDLDAVIHQFFDEPQVYRMDHYLGKETVQNLLVLRFANPLFEHSWNRDRVENVQITVAEELGLEGRAQYYDRAGALRDMVQNHLTQLLSLIAMEPPSTLSGEAVRNEKVKVLQSIAPVRSDDIVFGQYTGYREEPGVKPNSKTETAVALKLEIANWRWQGVPFFLRTGKRFGRRVSKIVINFRCAPVSVFAPFGPPCRVQSNVFEITLQKDEGFDLHFEVKQPGQPVTLKTERLTFRYADAFAVLPDAYETLVLDVIRGDRTLFVRSDWVDQSWQLYDPLLKKRSHVHPYAPGSFGPPEFDRLLEDNGARWRTL